MFTALDNSSGYATFGMAINDMGVVAGSYASSTPDGNVGHGFTYLNGIYTSFDVPGAEDTYLSGINNPGVVVGVYYDAFGFYGFVNAGGTITRLADPLAVGATIPVGINDSGEIVGNYTDSNGVQHGFVYANGIYTTVDAPGLTVDPATGLGTALTGINNAGDLVGNYITGPLSDEAELSFVDIGGDFTTIVEPDEIPYPGAPPGDNTFADGISNSGVVVGSYLSSEPGLGSPLYGFLATPGGAPVAVDEPASLLLVCAGLASAAMLRLRRRTVRS